MRDRMCEVMDDLPRHIDISCVRSIHSMEEIDAMIDGALRYEFAAVFTLPAFSRHVAERLKGQLKVKAGGVVGFPSGGCTTETKVFEARQLRGMGCGELDMVMNLTAFQSGLDAQVIEDIHSVVRAAAGLPVKVIIEAPSLTREEIQRAVRLCIDGGATYAKSGTGWLGKTTAEHIRIMKEAAGERIMIKAAGGIRDLKTIEAMAREGCQRFGIGLNAALAVMEELKVAGIR